MNGKERMDLSGWHGKEGDVGDGLVWNARFWRARNGLSNGTAWPGLSFGSGTDQVGVDCRQGSA